MKKATVPSILVAVVLLAVGVRAEAQQARRLARIAYVTGVSHSNPAPEEEAFRHGLRDLGYIDGKNISIESSYAEGKLDRIPSLVNELVQQRVDIIVATNNVAIVAAKQATKAIPIVMVSSIDPVVAGYVDSVAHPGGNVTGLATMNRELSAKRVELLKELIPNVSRIAMLWGEGPGPIVASKEYHEAARRFKVQLQSLELHDATLDIEGAFRATQRERAEGLIIITNPLTLRHRERIIELANRNRLPSMTEDIRFMDAGGFSCYGANIPELYRRAATYVDRILKGAKPADLPVEQPMKFEFVINLKTAKQIGLTIPPSVLYQADKVIK